MLHAWFQKAFDDFVHTRPRLNQRYRLNRFLSESCFPKNKEYFTYLFFFRNIPCMQDHNYSVRQSRVNQRWRLNRLLFKSCFPKNNKKNKEYFTIFFLETNYMHAWPQTAFSNLVWINAGVWTVFCLTMFSKKHGNLVYIFLYRRKKYVNYANSARWLRVFSMLCMKHIFSAAAFMMIMNMFIKAHACSTMYMLCKRQRFYIRCRFNEKAFVWRKQCPKRIFGFSWWLELFVCVRRVHTYRKSMCCVHILIGAFIMYRSRGELLKTMWNNSPWWSLFHFAYCDFTFGSSTGQNKCAPLLHVVTAYISLKPLLRLW